jgi:hypothetical protein
MQDLIKTGSGKFQSRSEMARRNSIANAWRILQVLHDFQPLIDANQFQISKS